ncbi:MAG: hypothetical protein C5B59_13440 [Bacteroidetes bacterium]|nr:MAG: hypothetical protein C5B59_13440 [Bacteroidota bacterium]
MEQTVDINRNFDAISPTAKWILLMKGHTDIPFARQAAELIQYPEKFIPDFQKKDLGFWARTLHFEARYWSINQLLKDISVQNILELSAGFSFRGLDFATKENVYYIDTDLPDMIEQKQPMVLELMKSAGSLKGKLELLPLNALDGAKFNEIANRFPPGEVAIVNEGLLVYLDQAEKERLCEVIRDVLRKRGGYWITGDIYLKVNNRNVELTLDEKTKKIFEEQQVEAKRFESFGAAEAFFKKMGFVIDKEAEPDYTAFSSFPFLISNSSEADLLKMLDVGKIHATWRLKLAEGS